MKKSTFASILKYLVTLCIAGGLLWWVFKEIKWNEFIDNLNKVDYSWVIFSMALSFSSYVARAYRWKLLINPLGYQLKTSRSLLAVFTGYIANLVFPRLGEVTRCAVLKKNDDIPMPLTIGTVVTERLFDLIMLLVLFGFTLVLEFDILYNFFFDLTKNVPNPSGWIFGVIFSLLTLVACYFLFQKKINQYLMRSALTRKLVELSSGLIEGLLSFKKIEHKAGFILSTIFIWLVYFLMTYVITFSMPETEGLGIVASLTMLVGAGVALAIPVQGGFGTYHAIIATLLVFYNIPRDLGAFFATLLHTSQIVVIIIFGLISVVISLLLKRKSYDDKDAKQDLSTKQAAGGTPKMENIR